VFDAALAGGVEYGWPWAAVIVSLGLHGLVIYVPAGRVRHGAAERPGRVSR
jgi:hypothetical protein